MPTTITLDPGLIKTARADLVKRRLILTLEFALTEEHLALRRELALLSIDESPVEVIITEQQRRLFD